MRTVGLIGGTGWISTAEYYRLINEEVGRRLGGLEAAKLILYSFNYGDIDRLNRRNDREGVLELLQEAAWALAGAGADGLLLCANTLHQYADGLQEMVSRPILHIADATAKNLRRLGLTRVGLLGTRATMEKGFYARRLAGAGIRTLVPEEADRTFIHDSIYRELLRGDFRGETRERFLDIIARLARDGAEGVVLGCTEIPLLVHQKDTEVALLNTLVIHALAAVDFAVGAGDEAQAVS